MEVIMRRAFPQVILKQIKELVELGFSFEEVQEKVCLSLESIRYGFSLEEMRLNAPSKPQRAPRYYIVGATWEEDMYDEFIEKGYWKMGYDDEDIPFFTQRRDSIKRGDYIAIKKMTGGRPSANEKTKQLTMVIRSAGKVINNEDGIVYIQWLWYPNLTVPLRNCTGTIHGPYTLQKEREWLSSSHNKWLTSIFMAR
jgi:hypothetical protein